VNADERERLRHAIDEAKRARMFTMDSRGRTMLQRGKRNLSALGDHCDCSDCRRRRARHKKKPA
jgi:hypothetical protein